MTEILTYKYRIKDRRAQKVLRAHAIACNQVWNWCVAQQRDTEARYRAGGLPRRWLTGFSLAKACNGAGAELGLRQQTVQEVCRQFATSRDKLKRAPRFRASLGPRRSLGWVPFLKQSRRVDGNSIVYLGKRYRFFGSKRRPLPETAKGGCFVEDALGRWFVCFQVEAPKRRCGNAAIGIDLGLKSLATMSDGRKVETPRHYRAYELKLATAQRAGNMQRAKRLHAKIKNCRRDFLHKLSAELVREHGLIAVGNVNSASLAKTRMAKSVFDAGWSMFRTQLQYKCQQAGAAFLDVDEAFTTQACSQCGSLPPERPKGIAGLGIREWECSDCGASHDRDVNAARNILALALSAQRLAGESRGQHHGWCLDKHARRPAVLN